MRIVKFSKKASLKLEALFNYLETEWSSKVKEGFIEKLDKSIKQIQNFPESNPQSEILKGLHKSVVTKQTSIYYKYDKNTIMIVAIIDNRMDLKKLKKDL